MFAHPKSRTHSQSLRVASMTTEEADRCTFCLDAGGVLESRSALFPECQCKSLVHAACWMEYEQFLKSENRALVCPWCNRDVRIAVSPLEEEPAQAALTRTRRWILWAHILYSLGVLCAIAYGTLTAFELLPATLTIWMNAPRYAMVIIESVADLRHNQEYYLYKMMSKYTAALICAFGLTGMVLCFTVSLTGEHPSSVVLRVVGIIITAEFTLLLLVLGAGVALTLAYAIAYCCGCT